MASLKKKSRLPWREAATFKQVWQPLARLER